MALTISEFERKIVAEALVPSRNRAKRISTYIRANRQGRSVEAFYALVPGMMNEALSPSFSIATLIAVFASKTEWK